MSGWFSQPGRLLSAALAGVCALLLVVLLLQGLLVGSDRDADVAVAPRDTAGAGDLTTREFELPPVTEYAEITARPLFHEDRRPEPEQVAQDGEDQEPAQSAALEPPPVRLTGVIITPNARVAMLDHNRRNEQLSLKPGEHLEGWTLESVDERRVVFASGGTREPLLLEVYTGSAGGGRGPRGDDREQAAEEEEGSEQSAADLIRERIARERERRRELIEQARERQEQSDNGQ